MQNPDKAHRPVPGALPFNNMPGPLSPQDALRLPPDNVFHRMYWASVMFAVALKAQAKKHITGMVIQQNLLEEEIKLELAHKRHHKRKGHIGRQDGGPGHEEGFDAGEIDQFDNGPDVPEMYKNHDEQSGGTHWLLRLIRIYYMSLVLVYNMLGLKRDEAGELSDEALDDWLVVNQNNLEFTNLKLHLLNNLSEHAFEFDVKNVELAEHFINRLSATLLMEGKTVHDLQAVNQLAFGKAVADAFVQQLKAMSALANEMVSETTNALTAAGIKLMPAAPSPSLTLPSLDRGLAEIGAPALHATPAPDTDPGQQLTQWRLAVTKRMFPHAPTPQNAQRRAHAQKTGHDVATFNTHEALCGELEHYAHVMGVAPQVLEQAADKTLLKALGDDGQKDHPTKKSMRATSAFSSHAPKPKPSEHSLLGRLAKSMKPMPPSSRNT